MSASDEAVSHFCGITGADEERARRLLEACNWNLELAINMHVDNDQQAEVVRPPIAPVRQILNPEPMDFNEPANNPRRPRAVYDAFRDFQEEANYQEILHGEGADAASISVNRRVTLQQLYRPPLELMCRGSLTLARETGQEQNKWVLVNIQNGSEFSCQVLNRDVWSNQAVKDIIKSNFVFWQVYHDSYEGTRYVRFYNVKETDLPHVAIVDPRTGELMKAFPKSIDPASFCDSVTEFLIDNPSPNGEIINKSEDAQLAAAISASLKEVQDTEPQTVEQKPFYQEPPYEKPTEQQQTREQQPTEKRPAEKQPAEQKPTEQQPTDNVFEGPECKIALRFPDGSTLVKSFGAQQKLGDVYKFVRCEKSTSSIEFIAPPNRKMGGSHMDTTLFDLGLCPASRLEVKY